MRQPWTRNDTSFIKNWQLAGPFNCKLESECADYSGWRSQSWLPASLASNKEPTS